MKDNSKPLDSESHYNLKKSSTQNEKMKNMQTEVGFSPIRLKRNNVIMAYNLNQIHTNPQIMVSAGGAYHTNLKSDSKKQLGF